PLNVQNSFTTGLVNTNVFVVDILNTNTYSTDVYFYRTWTTDHYTFDDEIDVTSYSDLIINIDGQIYNDSSFDGTHLSLSSINSSDLGGNAPLVDSNGYNIFTGIYPIPLGINYSTISSIKDLMRLESLICYLDYANQTQISINLDANISLYDFDEELNFFVMHNQNYLPNIEIVANGYVLYNDNNSTTIFSDNVNIDSTGLTILSGFGTDPSTELAADTTILPSVNKTYLGDGTEDFPYLIKDANELKHVLTNYNNADVYIIFINDIFVNSQLAYDYTLGLNSIDCKVNIDGAFYHLVNLDGQLFDSLSGSIKNLKILYSGANDADYIICETTNANSVIDKIIFEESVSFSNAPSNSIICDENNGTISNIENRIQASCCIVKTTNNGIVDKCLDLGGCTTFSVGNNNTNCFVYINNGFTIQEVTYSGKSINGNDITYFDDLSYENISESPLLDTFGFYVLEPYEYPRLKTIGVLRTEIDNLLSCDTLSNVISEEYYDGMFEETLVDLQSGVIDFDNVNEEDLVVTYSWLLDAEEYNELTLTQLGTYTLNISIVSDYYFNFSYSTSITLIKGTFPTNLSLGSDFNAYSVEYTGDNIIPNEINVASGNNNLQTFIDAGFIINYSINATMKNSGNYTQTISLTSNLYNSPNSVNRTITVSKKNITLTIGNINTKYKEGFSYPRGNITATSFVGDDALKDFYTICEESGIDNIESRYVTTYTINSVVGEYNLTFNYSGLVLANYNITSSSTGKIIVGKANINQEDIAVYLDGEVFDENPITYNGLNREISLVFTNQELEISSSSNTINKDVGDYIATFTIGSSNYVSIEKEVEYSITKATFTITANSASYSYGKTIYQLLSLWGYSTSEPLGQDSNLVSGLTITFSIDGHVDNEEILYSGEYSIVPNISGTLSNYNINGVNGVLTIEKESLTVLYKNNESENTDFKNLVVPYSGNVVTRQITYFSSDFYTIEYTYYNSVRDVIESSEILNASTYYVRAVVTPKPETIENMKYKSTTYECSVQITKLNTSITFNEIKYEYTYSLNSQLDSEIDYFDKAYYTHASNNIDDESKIVLTAEKVISTQQSTPVNSITQVGTYRIIFTFPSETNRNGCSANVLMEVKPQNIIVNIEDEYEYTAEHIVIEITGIEYAQGLYGAILESSIRFTYSYTSGSSLSYITSVGEYIVTATSQNANYIISNAETTITISPKAITIDAFDDFSFVYGSSIMLDGLYTLDNFIFRRTINCEETNNVNYVVQFTLNCSYSLDGLSTYNIGEYLVDSDCIIKTGNFNVSLNGSFTITITKKALDVYWKIGNQQLDSTSGSMIYNGAERNNELIVLLDGYAQLSDAESVTVTKNIYISAAKTNIKDVGTYTIIASISGNLNYKLNEQESTFTLVVSKYTINVKINDINVRQKEDFNPTFSLIGNSKLQGTDEGKTLTSLYGFNFVPITTYNKASSTAGSVHELDGTLTFKNYDVYLLEKGTITVLEPYRDYSLQNRTFVYDGTKKSIYVNEEVEAGASIVYEGNGVINAGIYNVVANVTYPSGRTTILRATITILKATPVVTCEDEYTLFKSDVQLSASSIGAVAKINNTQLSGIYTYTQTYNLLLGDNTYVAKFTPADSKNYNEVEFNKRIISYEITDNALLYSGEYEFVDESVRLNDIVIVTNFVVELNKEIFNEVFASRLLLKKNGVSGQRFVINDAEKNVVFSIDYVGEEVYRCVYNFSKKEQESDSDKEPSIDYNILSIEGLTINENSSSIRISNAGAIISLPNEYKDKYSLYVNDVLVTDSYQLEPNTENVKIEIRDKTFNDILFFANYTVQTEQAEQEGPKVKEFKTYYWFIIGGVAGALLLAAFIIIVVRRR
ncbi:MAG: hypothetical protein K5765_02265, partial [Clostridia bacterium]|nr:hypothetical protein [Clostridia bacterium]